MIGQKTFHTHYTFIKRNKTIEKALKKEMEKERKRLEIKSRQEREEYERKIAEKESREEDLF